jgi:hypothetical protein
MQTHRGVIIFIAFDRAYNTFGGYRGGVGVVPMRRLERRGGMQPTLEFCAFPLQVAQAGFDRIEGVKFVVAESVSLTRCRCCLRVRRNIR